MLDQFLHAPGLRCMAMPCEMSVAPSWPPSAHPPQRFLDATPSPAARRPILARGGARSCWLLWRWQQRLRCAAIEGRGGRGLDLGALHLLDGVERVGGRVLRGGQREQLLRLHDQSEHLRTGETRARLTTTEPAAKTTAWGAGCPSRLGAAPAAWPQTVQAEEPFSAPCGTQKK